MRKLRAGKHLGCVAVLMTSCTATPSNAPDISASTEAAPSWTTVWFEDFNGDTLDRSRWTPEESCWGGGNNERQCYTDRPANIEVSDGILKLKARKEEFTAAVNHPNNKTEALVTQQYTSGKISTHKSAAWKYGKFSARMKLPSGQGTWPAFWMMPVDAKYGPWPLSGELDIMEAVNLGTPCPDCPTGVEVRTSGAAHFGDREPDNTYLFSKTSGLEPGSPAEEWRVYALEWGEGRLQWMVDGKVFMRLTADDWYTAAPQAEGRDFAPFDQPFYIMLNLAVGGNLAEKSNNGGFDPASFPAELQVDWVKVETCDGDEATGLACLDDQEWTGTPMGPWEVQAR
ncbi:glycoside hydrolase family 16 protein [Henriciella sp.]|jgi:beta-glucanase (GH16 family)|uniref:glycoside hydrolase family 16 protein n=2 Tax=Hyphomonadaceae TaxID=69657 RepID=UPI003559E8AA